MVGLILHMVISANPEGSAPRAKSPGSLSESSAKVGPFEMVSAKVRRFAKLLLSSIFILLPYCHWEIWH